MVTVAGGLRKEKTAIYHPRRPYYIEAFRLESVPIFAIVKLTKGFWRVLHASTGLTMADTDERWVAIEFIQSMGKEMTARPELQEAFDHLSWDGFMTHVSGENKNDRIQLVISSVQRYTKRVGYVGVKVTEQCRYQNTPEYMI